MVPEMSVYLIADLVRDQGPDGASSTLDEIIDCATDSGVVGVGLGGSEPDHPAHLFAEVFQRARKRGLRRTAHAGEAAGPESVWSAMNSLGVERIGHGVRAHEDRALVGRLVETRLPLEVCPSSNVATGIFASIDQHPIRSLYDAGVVVTVNSDDPSMFRSDLVGELTMLRDRLGFGEPELRDLVANGIIASWLPETTKRDLIRRVEQSDTR